MKWNEAGHLTIAMYDSLEKYWEKFDFFTIWSID